MRWVGIALRMVFGLAMMSGPLVAPKAPLWQVIGGISYALGVLQLITLLDDDLDILAYLAIDGVSGPDKSPFAARCLLVRILVVLAFWLILLAVGWVLLPLSIVTWPMDRAVSPWYYLVGTLIGAVIYLVAVGWYRKSMRRRYGY